MVAYNFLPGPSDTQLPSGPSRQVLVKRNCDVNLTNEEKGKVVQFGSMGKELREKEKWVCEKTCSWEGPWKETSLFMELLSLCSGKAWHFWTRHSRYLTPDFCHNGTIKLRRISYISPSASAVNYSVSDELANDYRHLANPFEQWTTLTRIVERRHKPVRKE